MILENDGYRVALVNPRERPQHDHQARFMGRDRDNVFAKDIRNGAQRLTGSDAVAEFHLRFEESGDRSRVANLHVTGIFANIVDDPFDL